MVGDEASQLRSMLEVSYPMENGVSDMKIEFYLHVTNTNPSVITCYRLDESMVTGTNAVLASSVLLQLLI